MFSDEIRLQAEKRLLEPISDGKLEVVVTYRRHDDYAAYEATISSLKSEVDSLKQDVFKWSQYGRDYLSSLDEINRLKKILRKHNIDF